MTFAEWLGREPAADPKKVLSQDVVQGIDRFDREDLDALQAELKEYRDAREMLCDVAEMGDHLTSDTTMGFYKVGAEVVPLADMDPDFIINHAVQTELWQTPEWQRLHTWTEGDLVASGLGFVAIEQEVEGILSKAKELVEKAKDLEKEKQEYEAAKDGERILGDMVEDWMSAGELTDEEVDAMTAMADRIAAAMAAAGKQLGDHAGEIDTELAGAVAAAMPDMRQKMAEEADKNADQASAMRAWGMEPGTLTRMPAAERLKLAERLSQIKDFKKLTDLMGMMRRIAETEQTRKVYHSFEEVYDIGIGNDLGRVLPSEMLSLLNPKLKLDFYRKFAEGKLLQYEMRGNESVGKGGIILCKDDSLSMQGDPERWAKAVAGATLAIAKEQKRSFVGLNFGSRTELMEFDFRTPDDYSLEKVINYIEFFWNGGTDFVRPLSRALEILQAEEREKGFVEGDIVFVTDGICRVPDEWLASFKAEQARLGFKVWGIMIGGDRKSEPLWGICDGNVVTITDLLSGDDVREMFRGL